MYTFAWVFLDSIAQFALQRLFTVRLTENIVWGPHAGIIHLFMLMLCRHVIDSVSEQEFQVPFFFGGEISFIEILE